MDPAKVANDMIRFPSGSVSSAKSEREVNTLAVSRVVPPPLFLAKAEKTAKVKMGAMTGVMYAAVAG